MESFELYMRAPQQSIGDPMFTILEVLIITMMPAMVALMVAVHAWAPMRAKTLSLTSLIFMGLLAGVTCSLHFMILTLSHQPEFSGQLWQPLVFSFMVTSFRMPLFSREGNRSRMTAVCVLGNMLMQNGTSRCPVFTPNGTQGRTSTRAPRSHAIFAASAATASDSKLSVA